MKKTPESKARKVLGIDIGGSGIKGAVVDVKSGKLISERIRIPTPKPYSPEGVLSAIEQIVGGLKWSGTIGCGFPGVVRSQVIESALNLGESFTGINLAEEIGRRCACNAWVINDADAAGSAEVKFGAGRGKKGVVLMLTIGTGIGAGLFVNGTLVPNMEFGSLKMRDKKSGKNVIAERICSDAARKKGDLSWAEWASRFNKYLQYIHSLTWPDLIILGGGVCSKSEKFFHKLDVNCDLALAKLENRAGIVGAAYEASLKF